MPRPDEDEEEEGGVGPAYSKGRCWPSLNRDSAASNIEYVGPRMACGGVHRTFDRGWMGGKWTTSVCARGERPIGRGLNLRPTVLAAHWMCS